VITTSAPYSSSPPYVAGVFARARGLGAWAGYFEQRLFGTGEVVGRKFVPNRLQYSQIPYTAGQKVREIESSKKVAPTEIVFDGNYIWAIQMDVWAIEPYVWLLDPVTGDLVDEFRIEDSSGNVGHKSQEAILAGGYIWIANWWNDDCGLTRVDPDTHEAVHYQTGDHPDGNNDGGVDLVYDDQSAGGPYIWVVNRHLGDSTYSVSRMLVSDPTIYDEYSLPIDRQCNSWRVISKDVGVVEMKDLNYPTGITLQPNESEPANPIIWISFGGYTRDKGEGVAKFSADDPSDTFEHYCTGPGRGPDDIAYGGGYVWVANNPHYDKPQDPYEGFTRFDPNTEVIDHYYFGNGATKIEFDDQSAGGSYVWLSNLQELLKYDTSGTQIHLYPLLNGRGGFDFDRASGADDYVWSAHSTAGSVSRNMIDDPYSTNIYLIKGAPSEDIVFDGTHIWTANRYGNTVVKYRASDGVKVGNYEAGWHPNLMAYDGTYIWVRHFPRSDIGDLTKLTQIRASDGLMMDSYNTTAGYDAFDMIFDGTYLWISDGVHNNLRRVDTATCNPGFENSCITVEYPIPSSPDQMVFDGDYIWVTQRYQCDGNYNCFSKIDQSGAIKETYSIPDAYQEGNSNLKAIEFDGTYLWIGTQHVDDEGNSVYKIDPADGTVVGKYRIYTEPGLCESGGREHLYCTRNDDCPDDGTCSANSSEIRAITFDGTQIWILQGRVVSSSPKRECNDDYDNDGNGFCDSGGCCDDGSNKNQTDCTNDGFTWMEPDSNCQSSYDLHEGDSSDYFGTSTDVECRDNIDNNGNGLCDYDGAVGYPGCSGKPDPVCASADDQSEATNIYTELNMTHLTRIMAATGEVVESIPHLNYCSGDADIVFDGTSVWFNEEDGCGGYMLYQYYAGSGLGLTDFGNTVSLQSSLSGTGQPGSFSVTGSASFGAKLTVIGDLVVVNNTWGGTVDNERDFGVGCDDGEFVKGVDITVGKLQCRPL